MDKKAQMFLNRAQVVRDVRNFQDALMPFLALVWTKSIGNTLYVIAASRAAKTVTGMGVPESHPSYLNDSCREDALNSAWKLCIYCNILILQIKKLRNRDAQDHVGSKRTKQSSFLKLLVSSLFWQSIPTCHKRAQMLLLDGATECLGY